MFLDSENVIKYPKFIKKNTSQMNKKKSVHNDLYQKKQLNPDIS